MRRWRSVSIASIGPSVPPESDDTDPRLRYPLCVIAFRRLLAQRRFVVLLCAATLLLKLLIPTGYMIANENGHPAITICSGIAPENMAMAMPGMHDDTPDHGKNGYGKTGHGKKDHGRAEMPCAFSGLSVASLGAIDPIQLAALVAFILSAGLFPAMLSARRERSHLRPPLRGPPACL